MLAFGLIYSHSYSYNNDSFWLISMFFLKLNRQAKSFQVDSGKNYNKAYIKCSF